MPTVYTTYGSKAGLALALADAARLSADMPRYVDALEAAGGRPAELDNPGADIGIAEVRRD